MASSSFPRARGFELGPTTPFLLFSAAHPTPPLSLPTPTEPWFSALVLVTFDLDQGQIVEAVEPRTALEHAPLRDAICVMSMPDSAAGGSGEEDALYSFKTRLSPSGPLLNAHTLFRQAPDPSSPRGFFQKALVIVTPLNCLALPRAMLRAMSSVVFTQGVEAMRKAVRDIARWPTLDGKSEETKTARTIDLPLAGSILTVSVPEKFMRSFAAPACIAIDTKSASRQYSSAPGGKEPRLVREWPLVLPMGGPDAALFHEVDLSRALAGMGKDLWTLWELVVCGEPLLVVGKTPAICSAAIMAIVGLIHPLPFVGDYRPYLCMQDPDYLEFLKAKRPLRNGSLIGMTNTHMAANLNWPLQLQIGINGGAPLNSPTPGQVASSSRGMSKQAGISSASSSSAGIHAGGGPNNGNVQLKPARSTHLRKSKKAIKLLDSQTSLCGANGALRSYFAESITGIFLRAFDRYLTPIRLNDEHHADPFGHGYTLREFNQQRFPTEADLSDSGAVHLFKKSVAMQRRSHAKDLYQRFMAGPVFDAWFPVAQKEAKRLSVLKHREEMLAYTIANLHATVLRLPGSPGVLSPVARTKSRNGTTPSRQRERLSMCNLDFPQNPSGSTTFVESDSSPEHSLGELEQEHELILRIRFEIEQAKGDKELESHLKRLCDEATACLAWQ